MDLAFWRDVALVVLVVEGFFLGLVPLVLFYLGTRGLRRLNHNLPHYSRSLKRGWQRVDRRVTGITATIRRPFEVWHQLSALFAESSSLDRE